MLVTPFYLFKKILLPCALNQHLAKGAFKNYLTPFLVMFFLPPLPLVTYVQTPSRKLCNASWYGGPLFTNLVVFSCQKNEKSVKKKKYENSAKWNENVMYHCFTTTPPSVTSCNTSIYFPFPLSRYVIFEWPLIMNESLHYKVIIYTVFIGLETIGNAHIVL